MQHGLDLNPKQREAAEHMNGPLLILAGAGAGKTKTITHRIIHLIEKGVPPEQILAITFTNKAAKEMRERTLAMLEKDHFAHERVPFMSTFHALCVYILKAESRQAGTIKHFSILDEDDARRLMKEAVIASGRDPKEHEPRKWKSIISRLKNDFVTLADCEAGARTHNELTIASIWREYDKLCRKENAFDFDDLLIRTVEMLSKNEAVRLYYQEKWKYIHVDEYQDTNEVQYKMVELLAAKYKNLCVVGDGDQNIYGWRGANMKNILNFEKDYPDAKVVLLEENYRSTSSILDAANAIIKKNKLRKEKNLFTKRGEGDPITMYEAYDENDEAGFVAESIYELIGTGVDPKDIAILYRANFQSRVLEEALLMKAVPYQVLGVKFFERKEVKDVLAYIKSALNPDSLSDIKRIINLPARGIGKVTLAKLFAGEKDSLTIPMQKKIEGFYALLEDIHTTIDTIVPSLVIKHILAKSGIERELAHGTEDDLERLENMKELVTLATKYDTLPQGEGMEKLLEDAALATDQDTLDVQGEKSAVRLMTVHASKGLEFKYVFITGLEQDLFPHSRSSESKSPEDREEERRLFYVALTRAKEKLFLSYATIRTLFGMRQITAPSEFIYDIPDHLVERQYSRNTKTVYLD